MEKELIIFALNFLEANTDSVSVQERLLEITGTDNIIDWELEIDRVRNFVKEE
ncbi:MAG: hypothetical protein J7L15_08300 [Clostridiales bacterium]|nr:hypothetical protein [Clostridiales bacterium]